MIWLALGATPHLQRTAEYPVREHFAGKVFFISDKIDQYSDIADFGYTAFFVLGLILAHANGDIRGRKTK